VIRDHAYSLGFPFFSKLTNVLRGCTNTPTDEKHREAWQHVAERENSLSCYGWLKRLYILLSAWVRTRYAGDGLVPVNCLKRFYADFNEVRDAISAAG